MTKKKKAKTAFVIAPIGEPKSATRKRSDEILEYLIKPVVENLGYKPLRADQISKTGDITDQIMKHIFRDPLVIADLTEHNPNVFYELAVRHTIQKPSILLIHAKQKLPFDVSHVRMIKLYKDIPSHEKAKEELEEQIRNLEEQEEEPRNPTTTFMNSFTDSLVLTRVMDEGYLNKLGESKLRELLDKTIGALKGQPLTKEVNAVFNKYLLGQLIGVRTKDRVYDIELDIDLEFEIPLMRADVNTFYIAENNSSKDMPLFGQDGFIEKGKATIPIGIRPLATPTDPEKIFSYTQRQFKIDSRRVNPTLSVGYSEERNGDKVVDHSAKLERTITSDTEVKVNFGYSVLQDQMDYIMRRHKTICEDVTVNVVKPKDVEIIPIWFLTAGEPHTTLLPARRKPKLFSQKVRGITLPGNGFAICWRPKRETI